MEPPKIRHLEFQIRLWDLLDRYQIGGSLPVGGETGVLTELGS